MPRDQRNSYPLRLPYELMEKFKVISDSHDRSVNAEIMQLVKKAVAAYESEHGEIKVPDE